jgi:hypothetical protein
MIEHILLNTNENATLRKILTFHDINLAQVEHLAYARNCRTRNQDAADNSSTLTEPWISRSVVHTDVDFEKAMIQVTEDIEVVFRSKIWLKNRIPNFAVKKHVKSDIFSCMSSGLCQLNKRTRLPLINESIAPINNNHAGSHLPCCMQLACILHAQWQMHACILHASWQLLAPLI